MKRRKPGRGTVSRMRVAADRRREGITEQRGGPVQREGLRRKRAGHRDRMKPSIATTAHRRNCNPKEVHQPRGSSYLITAPVRGGQFKAGFFLGIFAQVGGHPDAVALNEEGPFGLLACKTGKLLVPLGRRNCQGKASSVACERGAPRQLFPPRGTARVGDRFSGKVKRRLRRRQQGRLPCQARGNATGKVILPKECHGDRGFIRMLRDL